MATIGTLVMDLRANAAQFYEAMGGAQDSLGKTEGSMKQAERTAVSFATRGIGSVVPALAGMEHMLGKLIETTMRSRIAWLALGGQLAIIVVGVIAVAAAVQKLEEEWRNYMKLGETSKQTLDRIKAENEEQEKWAKNRRDALIMLTGLEAQLGQAQSARRVAESNAMGDKTQAAADEYQGAIDKIGAEQEVRRRAITEQLAMGEQRNKALSVSEQIALNDRARAYADYTGKISQLNTELAQKSTETLVRETQTHLVEIQRRIALRQKIEQEATQAASDVGLPGLFDQDQATKTETAAKKIAAGFAAMSDAQLNSAQTMDKIQQASDALYQQGFPNLIQEIQNARVKLKEFGVDASSINQSISDLSQTLAISMTGAINTADPALWQLIQRLSLIRDWANAATASINNMESALAGAGGGA